MRRFRLYGPFILLATGCVLVWQTRSQVVAPLSAPLNSVLNQVDGYAVEEDTIDAKEQRVAGMTGYVARTYRNNGALAFTTLVSYYDRQTQGRSIHSPRNCLPGAGWEIVQRGIRLVPDGGAAHRVNRYLLKNGPHVAIVYYWYQGRGRVTASEYAVKWNLLRDAAMLGRTEEALVRVVVPLSRESVTRPDSAAVLPEDSVASDVASRMIRDVRRALPARHASPGV